MDNLTHLMGDGIRIAIIDSGSSLERKEFNTERIYNINLASNSEMNYDDKDNIGHGTATSFIVHNRLPNSTIYSVKLFDENKETSIEELMDALKYIVSTLDVDIIHLSNGVTYCEKLDELEELCNHIEEIGIVMVAAFDNSGVISYPSSFDSVIGVDWHELCTQSTKYYYVENSIVNIMGMGSVQRLPWKNQGYKRVAGSSFAAPHITAMIGKIMESGINHKNEILIELKKNAFKVIHYEKQSLEDELWINTIKKAIIFPFNKEIHSLLRFSDDLSFSIEGIYEPTGYSKVNKNSELNRMNITHNVSISHMNEIDWKSDFDTVILGHSTIVNTLYTRDFIKEFIELCALHSKNLYSFDDLSDYHEQLQLVINSNVYYPSITHKQVPVSNINKLYTIPCPVLGVFGTGPRQGKFTLQLTLRRLLRNKGYRVGQLGTEPSALLYGMDEVYPMGFNSSVKVTGADAVSVVNQLLFRISRENPDIILVGSQSQSVPYSMGNIGFYPHNQHDFLLGSEPDAIILCVNPNDDLDYIKRTINYLENFIESKVIALSVFPVIRESEWKVSGENGNHLAPEELIYKQRYFEQHFNLPAFIIGSEQDNYRLLSKIEDYFTSTE